MNNKEAYCGPAIKQIHVAFLREKKMGIKGESDGALQKKKNNQESSERWLLLTSERDTSSKT